MNEASVSVICFGLVKSAWSTESRTHVSHLEMGLRIEIDIDGDVEMDWTNEI